MNKKITLLALSAVIVLAMLSFKDDSKSNPYTNIYFAGLKGLGKSQSILMATIEGADLNNPQQLEAVRFQLHSARLRMKGVDIWLRYLDPLQYKKINSPLPVEWETEVFEKFEKPYKRDGAGFTLAELYLEEEHIDKDSLRHLVEAAIGATMSYRADSITNELKTYHHFFLCNRLHLLNLAAIYTTGFECPDVEQVVPELRSMMSDAKGIYTAFNQSFPETPLTAKYLSLYDSATAFVNTQPADYSQFDHYTFIRNYANPLFALNQQMIRDYKVITRSTVDYSLSKEVNSVFDKNLYYGQSTKGIFLRVRDEATLAEIDSLGKKLFYDPMLSLNNERSCASCHKPTEFFTDTVASTAFHFDHKGSLPRNTPTLINAEYNHLAMLDGKHISLQNQVKDVVSNPAEMNCTEKEILKKVMSCKDYKVVLKKLLKLTPQEPEVTIDHISSALTYYYSKYSKYYSPFDEAMNQQTEASAGVKEGFNLFMSKAQCATCHFVPQFNGVKPPYIGSEFEVLGVPADTLYKKLSADKGRYNVNPAKETMNAFRTGTVRNASKTAPYMHNGVFKTLEQVIDFYDGGGGAGRGLQVDNQTLSSDSLKLTVADKSSLIAFIKALDEKIVFEQTPASLPVSKNKKLNQRIVGGTY
jgi:cytochrome c peroxidase